MGPLGFAATAEAICPCAVGRSSGVYATGAVSGVVSTNALELGIDIGFLDVCFMAEIDWDYYTDAIAYIKVTILGKFDADDAALTSGRAVVVRSHGEVHVVTRVVGFKKIKFYTGENVWAGDLDLPEQQMHTSAYWLTVPRELYAKLPHPPAERRDGVAGVGITLRGMAQLLLMCGRHDIGLAIHGDEGRGPVVTYGRYNCDYYDRCHQPYEGDDPGLQFDADSGDIAPLSCSMVRRQGLDSPIDRQEPRGGVQS